LNQEDNVIAQLGELYASLSSKCAVAKISGGTAIMIEKAELFKTLRAIGLAKRALEAEFEKELAAIIG
jgi:hypothetical protein